MGKRKGLGIEHAYNKYVAPVYNAYEKMYAGQDPFPPKKVKRTSRDVKVPTLPTHRGHRRQGGRVHPPNPSNPSDPQPAPVGTGVSSRAIGFGTSSQHHSHSLMRCPPQRGLGYQKPGPLISSTFGQIKTQFCFDMTAPINFRNYGRMMFRQYAGFQHRTPWTNASSPSTGNRPTAPGSKTLAPTLRSRTINGFTFNTASRDLGLYKQPDTPTWTDGVATMDRVAAEKDDYCMTQINLGDLEVASWNANNRKYVPWNMYDTPLSSAPTAGGSAATQMSVFKNWLSPVIATAETATTSAAAAVTMSSPFNIIPAETKTFGDTFSRVPQNFMVHLGSGSVKLHFQNRVNTACDIEILVYQIKASTSGGLIAPSTTDGATSIPNLYENQITAAYAAKYKTGNVGLNAGMGGEAITATDILNNPSKPFMKEYKKYLKTPSVMKLVSSERFRLAGGAVKPATIIFPEVVYDSYVHQKWFRTNGDPALTNQYEWLQPHSYVVYVSLQGVLMPAFGATAASANSLTISTTGTVPVDTLTCTASVLCHGEYIERPLPCKSVSPSKDVQQLPEQKDITISSTHGRLLSGYVADPPVVTTTNLIIANSTL